MKYDKIINEFTQYLITLRYSNIVCYNNPNQVRHFLLYSNVRIQRLRKKHIIDYIEYLKCSKSERTNNKRSNVHINGYIISIKRFTIFLSKLYHVTISMNDIRYLRKDSEEKEVLKISQIQKLFEVCDNSKIGLRDKAMLALYYSCGLRRSEALHVQLEDIDFTNNVLFVRKGKGDKQRYIPFTKTTHDILKNYINVGRRRLNKKHKYRKVLLISNRGQLIQSQSLLIRLKVLCKQAEINQKIGLHTLRHSIATHLLQQEMDIYQISQFLGHSSLQSTQIYTHITNEKL